MKPVLSLYDFLNRLCHPLLTLFMAVYLDATSKKGMSSMELKPKLDIRSYQTAWLLLHKIRIFDKLLVRCVSAPSFTYADLTE